jgi:hypothetical protein
MKPLMRPLIIFALAISLHAADKKEERLADALMKANRGVAHANEKALGAAKQLDEYCQTKHEKAGIRQQDGLVGCVVPYPPPPKPEPEKK